MPCMLCHVSHTYRALQLQRVAQGRQRVGMRGLAADEAARPLPYWVSILITTGIAAL